MGLFDDVVLNAKNAAQSVGKMAGQLVDMSKLRISVSEVNAVLAEKLAGIDDLYAELAQLTEQLNVLQNKAVCPVCGKKVPQDAAFCSACGAKLTGEEPAKAEEAACCCEEEAAEAEKPEAEKPEE